MYQTEIFLHIMKLTNLMDNEESQRSDEVKFGVISVSKNLSKSDPISFMK